VLILRLPHHRWCLPLVGEEGDKKDVVEERLSVPSLGCPTLGAEQRRMEWNGVSGGRIGILPYRSDLIPYIMG
jgi:hypothetical protein